ncbi:hypothetical protein [Mycolicibacterium iranicum]|uniref:Uncharacterized protein n=1 Tax=Mycolicibacterium iranicum TaxID=912594 RepID=A0ABT4HK64_MYCIR|nr:hypothetical protein [Mycolicibacterium iranicum]MCZ0730597.1 hypothetical protein [Mycolicibacterium iranicum]
MRTPRLMFSACATIDAEDRCRNAELAIGDELRTALEAFPGVFCSVEEAAMVLAEEVDELWDEVRANRIGRARAEAVQVGAMALRFVADLYESGPASERYAAAARECHCVIGDVGPVGRTLTSSHEGFGYLKREYESLWSAVRFDDPARPAAVRVAAMAVRFIAEISGRSPAQGLVR